MDKRSAFRWAVLLGVVSGVSWNASGQIGEIRPGENLVVQGLPPIPVSLAGEVRRYTESRSASFADWHPTERSILICTRFANTAQVHRVRQPGGARTQLTFFDEPIDYAMYEPTAGRYFLFPKDTGGNEFNQIYRYDLADGLVTLLTDGGRSQNSGIEWSSRGDRIAYGSTRRNGADRDIYVMDPLDPKSDRLVLEVTGGGWSVLDWSPDDRGLLIGEYVSINESRLWLLDLQTGEKSPLTEPGSEPVSCRNAQFSKDGTGLYLTTDKDSEFQRLSHMDLTTRLITTLVDSIPPRNKRDDIPLDMSSRRGLYLAAADSCDLGVGIPCVTRPCVYAASPAVRCPVRPAGGRRGPER